MSLPNLIGIVAHDKHHGLGYKNGIPWKIKDDLKFFKTITTNHVVVMGRKTYQSIPEQYRPLSNRTNVVLTNSVELHNCSRDNLIYTNYINLAKVLEPYAQEKKNIYVAGGADVYKLLHNYIFSYLVTFIDKEYKTDTYFNKLSNDFYLVTHSKRHWSVEENCYFTFLKYQRTPYLSKHDHVYKNLLRKIVDENQARPNRTGIDTISIFGEQLTFDIEHNVPLLTSKRVAWKSCIEELLWFMRGDTDANILKRKNVNIWNGNSSKEFLTNVGLGHLEEGDCGANYSFQWRYFGQNYINCNTKYQKKTKYDQINNIINKLITDPYSRRIFLSAWNPLDIDNTVLPPCHVSAQFYVDNQNGLSCHMYQRSCDVFLGLPFNIFSYTTLTYILAKKCGFVPRKLVISLGDTHIYTNHIEQVKEQLNRPVYSYPKLKLSDDVVGKEIEEINIDDFELVGYFPNSAIKAPMAV